MKNRSVLSVLASAVLALGSAWCGPEADPPTAQNAIKTELAGKSELRLADPEKPAAESQQPAKAIKVSTSAPSTGYSEHAPLALFSVGSLAVGGVFYAIHLSTQHSKTEFSAGDRASLTNALGAAGLTALLAAGSYFYFSRQASEPDRDWDAAVSGDVSPDGDMTVGALVTFPLSKKWFHK